MGFGLFGVEIEDRTVGTEEEACILQEAVYADNNK